MPLSFNQKFKPLMMKHLFTALIVVCFAQGLYVQSARENKKIITRYLLEIFNDKKLELLGEVFPDRFVRHDLNDGTDTWMTVADQQKRVGDLFHAFPDFHYTIGDIIAEGDKVVVRAIWHGTQKTPL